MQASRRRRKYGKSHGLVPDYFADSVRSIDYGLLQEHGVRFIALDVDQTLTHNHELRLTEEAADFLNQQVRHGMIEGIFIASNSRRNLDEMAEMVRAGRVRATRLIRKPGRRYYRRLLELAKCRPGEIAMVGDRLFTDILGGNRAGMMTIMVNPYGPDLWIDRMTRMRSLETRYLKRHRGDEN